MAIHTSLLITRTRIDHGLVRQHGAPFIRNIEDISMAFLTLLIFKAVIGFLPVFFVIIIVCEKMKHQVLETMKGFGIKEFEGILRGRKMAIHAIGHKALGIVRMGGGLPGIVGRLNFVAEGAELGGRGSHHGVITDTEEGKGDQNTQDNQDTRSDDLPPAGLCFSGRTVLIHRPSLQRVNKG